MSTVTALPAPIALTLGEHLHGRVAIATAHLLTAALGTRPARLHQALTFLARGATPTPYVQAEHARNVVTTLSPRCGSGYGCLPRSIATALLCRQHGTWPTWTSGVRFPPLASHAWIEADGTPVGEDPAVIATFTPTLTVAPGESTP
ncbi:lasso peptide biosynthesis B2 protein [Streptomyces ipomoeae]|uniref:lasso peptide biosynthesis B2 protein n=1 Tax=Streptomyces ipomoeae TaxID=103232 RepID=UPI0029A59A93|nr:lasso peptide biosynthesis B2 protein [Streptomyces ipomoeae]MDX2819938.1 lasso peptide biosynthesis B2 protein [Streptomyces ipomoeae]MDX2872616.1 lasso peptide biosynthesis B2 protein [Streptomyces ipomoeae]